MSDDPSVRRRNLRADLLGAAQRLRAEGHTVNEIADRLRIAKSTAYRWVGHLPLDGSSEAAVQRRLEAEGRRAPHRADRRERREEAERAATNRAAEWVDAPALRELLLVGAVLYWCEGTKSKPANPRSRECGRGGRRPLVGRSAGRGSGLVSAADPEAAQSEDDAGKRRCELPGLSRGARAPIA